MATINVGANRTDRVRVEEWGLMHLGGWGISFFLAEGTCKVMGNMRMFANCPGSNMSSPDP